MSNTDTRYNAQMTSTPESGGGMDILQRRFGPDLYGPDRQADWDRIKKMTAIRTRLTGVVFLRSQYGVWVDVDMGFPALFAFARATDAPPGYPADGSIPVGSAITAKVARFADSGRVIYLRPAGSAILRRYRNKLTDWRAILRLSIIIALPLAGLSYCHHLMHLDPRITLEHLKGHTPQEVIAELGPPNFRNPGPPLRFGYDGPGYQRYGITFENNRVVEVRAVTK